MIKMGNSECLRASSKGILLGLNGFCIVMALFMLAGFTVDAAIVRQYGEENHSILGYVLLIIIAGFLIVTACFGGVGAARENIKYLSMYACMLTFLIALKLMLTVYISLQRYKLQFQVVNWLRDDFYLNSTDVEETERHVKLWQRIQEEFHCCGLNGPDDYTALGTEIDMSCCYSAFSARSAQARQLLHKACIRNREYYYAGCEDEILDTLELVNDYLCSILFFTFTFETAGILLSIWLAKNLRNEQIIYKETVNKY